MNSTYYFRNSSTDFNENSFKLIDGAQSYGKSYLSLDNSAAIFVDTSIEGHEGVYSPIFEKNSTFVLARIAKISAIDQGYPYPVQNITIKPLYNKTVSIQFENVVSLLSRFETYGFQQKLDNMIIVPYYYNNEGHSYNFTDFNYTVDEGLFGGVISFEPYPYMSNNASLFSKTVNIPIEEVTLRSADIKLAGVSSFELSFSGKYNLGYPLKILISVKNLTEGFNETFSTIAYPGANNTSFTYNNLTGIIPGREYKCSIYVLSSPVNELMVASNTSIKSIAVLNGNVWITGASVPHTRNGSGFLNASVLLNASNSVPGNIIITNGNSKISAVNVTFLPGRNNFSLPIKKSWDYANLSVQAKAAMLSDNTSNSFSVVFAGPYIPKSYNITFMENGLVNQPMWGVKINDSSYMFYGKEGNVSLNSGNYTLMALNPAGYRSNILNFFLVRNSSIAISVNFTEILFLAEFINFGADGHNWGLLIDGAIFETNQATLNISLPAGTYNYELIEPRGYIAIRSSSIINLTGNASIMIHSKKVETTFFYLESVVQTEKFEIGSPIILVSSIALLLYRRKHRWKLR